MAIQQLEDLPIEILWEICEILETSTMKTLHAFSLVNKRLRHAILPVLFRKAKFTMRGAKDLEEKLKYLTKISTAHIRELTIQGWIPEEDETVDEISNMYEDIRIHSEMSAYEARIHTPNRALWEKLGAKIKSQRSKVTKKQDQVWKPLASVIASVSSLRKLVYNAADQLPPCILECLHANHLNCKLYINTFWLRTLKSDPNPHLCEGEEAIITSPCLYGITTHFDRFSDFGRESYFMDAFSDIINVITPNLKELHSFHFYLKDRKSTDRLFSPKRPWEGFRMSEEHNLEKAQRSPEILSLEHLCRHFFRNLDTSSLRYLKIKSGIGFTKLKSMPPEYKFESVQTLSVNIGGRMFCRSHTYEEYSSAFVAFLSRFPSVKVFQCKGDFKLDTILDILGNKLEILSLTHLKTGARTIPHPLGNKDEACLRILQACPHIEYLCLELGRFPPRVTMLARCTVKNGVLEDV